MSAFRGKAMALTGQGNRPMGSAALQRLPDKSLVAPNTRPAGVKRLN